MWFSFLFLVWTIYFLCWILYLFDNVNLFSLPTKKWHWISFVQIAGGLCDNLLTCIVRAWDYSKPLFVAPAMNTFMWNNPFTSRHLETINLLGISLVPPITKRLACGDYGNGAMAEPSVIDSTVRLACKRQPLNTNSSPVVPAGRNLPSSWCGNYSVQD